MIYIYKNDQQSGPYEEHVVLDQLKAGLLSPEDMAVRHGETQWRPLAEMFPDVSSGSPAVQFSATSNPQPPASTGGDSDPQFRNTIIPKIFFGLCLLGALAGFAAAAFYFYSLMGPTGNLQADLSRMSYKILARNFAGAMLLGGIFVFIAFLLAFKKRLILSNGIRIALRLVFVFLMLIGFGSFAAGAITYLNYSAPYKISSRTTGTNELLEALEAGEAATGPYEGAAILVPIGTGLFLLGLSGALMTKKPRS